MEIAVMAGFFAERDMNIDAGHGFEKLKRKSNTKLLCQPARLMAAVQYFCHKSALEEISPDILFPIDRRHLFLPGGSRYYDTANAARRINPVERRHPTGY
jgi:hypothetical protein